ncbi:amidohydrolase family protein [Reinekea forsetii]|uniref:L-fuconolactone hydrolase n=2 Tax=Reinekea forsetii TaxID=1336806 RepID=A0A2K8KMI4_9GAMM|nr:amidohydrolase family protein [Reinekea forsetii]ATX75922.1 L-fuconolactone hydrolase [Reinekea forsetii]
MKIDSHQHFWRIDRGDYGWLTPKLELLYRDFLPLDLTSDLASTQVDGTILVQAAPTIAETEYLLTLADQHAFIKGVVGWVDFASTEAPDQIRALAQHPKLVGLRPMIQDIEDPNWMLGSHLTPAFEALIEQGLTFEALVLPHHLANLHLLVQRHPTMRVVIDHGAKPEIRNQLFTEWANAMTLLAQSSSVYCKVSGLVTEAGNDWTEADLAPYIALLVDVFGSQRLIWGSDWPVCLNAAGYSQWHLIAQQLLPNNTQAQEAIFGGNALRAYDLGV